MREGVGTGDGPGDEIEVETHRIYPLEGQIEVAGGQYRVGLYDTDIDVANVPARLQAAADGLKVPWLRETLQIPEDWEPIFANADSIFAGFEVQYIVEDVETRRPKLHLKTNLFVSASVLRASAPPTSTAKVMFSSAVATERSVLPP